MAKSARSKSKKAFRNIKKYDHFVARWSYGRREANTYALTKSVAPFRAQVEQSPLFLENEARRQASQAEAVASGQQAHEQVRKILLCGSGDAYRRNA